MSIKLATWNICLGLKTKKDYIYDTLNQMNIDICLLQEVEIAKDYQQSLLTSKNFKIEVESNDIKSRSAIIIRDNVNYTRRSDIEGKNLGIVIIDLNGHEKFRVINVYRSFNPPNMSQLEFLWPNWLY